MLHRLMNTLCLQNDLKDMIFTIERKVVKVIKILGKRAVKKEKYEEVLCDSDEEDTHSSMYISVRFFYIT